MTPLEEWWSAVCAARRAGETILRVTPAQRQEIRTLGELPQGLQPYLVVLSDDHRSYAETCFGMQLETHLSVGVGAPW